MVDEQDKGISGTGRQRFSLMVCAAMTVALAGIVVFTISGFGYQWRWWSLGTGFGLLKWGFYISVAGGILSIIAAFVTRPGRPVRGFGFSLAGIIISLAVCGTAWFFSARASSAPPIHDVTTDTQNPPQFKAVLPLRKDAPNKSAYFGSDSVKWHGKIKTVSQWQHQEFPDIVPIMLDVPVAKAYNLALAAAKKMSWWKIQSARPEKGRIEATSTIPWFGFKDDIVIRIDSAGMGSRIDIRSDSRLGFGDIGENARRIRSYTKILKKEAGI